MPLETLEVIYHIIFVFFSIFAVMAADAVHGPPPKPILHLGYVVPKDSPYQFSAKSDNSKYGVCAPVTNNRRN